MIASLRVWFPYLRLGHNKKNSHSRPFTLKPMFSAAGSGCRAYCTSNEMQLAAYTHCLVSNTDMLDTACSKKLYLEVVGRMSSL
jgi:hypothetical protein